MGPPEASVDALPGTAPGPVPLGTLRRARALRRVALGALALVILTALAGQLGVRTGTATVRAEGYEVTVTYGAVSRPGLATPFAVEVRRPGGFTEPVTIDVSSPYLEMFDENGLDPDPAQSTATPEAVRWTFDPPPGDVLGVSFDARIEPGVQWGRDGFAAVIVDEREVVRASFRTWVMP